MAVWDKDGNGEVLGDEWRLSFGATRNSFSRWRRLTQDSSAANWGRATTMLLATRPGKRLLCKLDHCSTREERLSLVHEIATRPVESLGTLTSIPTLPATASSSTTQNCYSVPGCSISRLITFPFIIIWNLTIPRLGDQVAAVWDYVYPFTILNLFYFNHLLDSNVPYVAVPLVAFLICLFQAWRTTSCSQLNSLVVCWRRAKPAPSIVTEEGQEVGQYGMAENSSGACNNGMIRTTISAAMALYWNGVLVAEALQCLMVVGEILQISPIVLGLTVVAWGNSTADLVANVSISKSGFTNMALSGAYGSSVLLFFLATATVSTASNICCYLSGKPYVPLRLDAVALSSIVSQLVITILWTLYMSVNKLVLPASSGVYLIVGFCIAIVAVLTTLTFVH